MYYSNAEDGLVAKTLREKCVNDEVKKIKSNIKNLSDVCITMDICYEKA
jgi:hypothetical protein